MVDYPKVWLRSFFGFAPEDDGYIGWSREGGRNHMLGKASQGDLMMIYAAGSAQSDPAEKLRVLGFLQIDPIPIRDIDKASPAGMERKRRNGWDDKWTFALPARRAWRVVHPTRIDQIAFKTYDPKKARAIAAWSPELEPDEVERVMALRVTEVPVYGEPEPVQALIDQPLAEAFRRAASAGSDPLAPADFPVTFGRFQDLLETKSGTRFTRFDEGLIGAWERYKPDLRRLALSHLEIEAWRKEAIGGGTILARTINAIEIQEPHGLTNNLVFWQNRYGHSNRDHRALLEAQRFSDRTRQGEQLLFDLFRGDRDEGSVFEELREWTGNKYPLLAYLFFLKDMSRFTPIQPTGFDRAFAALGVDLKTRSNCSWENYQAFNAALDGLRGPIAREAGLNEVRLIDAHSFGWMLAALLKQEANGELETGGKASEKILGARERSIADIRHSVNRTTFSANGQIVERKIKEKELHMTDAELDRRIRELFDVQGDRCAITGLPFQFNGACEDKNMLPSLDRIDSAGHYERSNVQLVCRFINFWKQAADDAEFRSLIMMVRREERETEAPAKA